MEEFLEISILRLSHRIVRDKRVTTHLALVGRAFCAKKMYYSGDRDPSIENKIREVNERFGGDFQVIYIDDPVKFVSNWRKEGGTAIHLTMYGIPLTHLLDELRRKERILLIVGSEKVPRVYYEIVDYNVSITNQPHSEIAAIAVFLDRVLDGLEFTHEFSGGAYRIIPSSRDKKLIRIR